MGLNPDIFTEEPPEEFNCSICFQVMKTPVQCNEGHMCCQVCLDEYLLQHPKCPTCSAPLPNHSYARSRAIESLIAAKTVRCDLGPREKPENPPKRQCTESVESRHTSRTGASRDDSCQWTGKLSELEAHLKICGYAPVPCLHDGCHANFRRDALEAHMLECPQRLSECSQCSAVLVFADLASHIASECPEVLSECAKQCGALVKRMDTATHQASCPREEVDCPCKAQGCMARPERQHMQQHMQDDAAQHMSFMAAGLVSATTVIQSLNNRLSSTEGELSTAQKKCAMLEEKCGLLENKCGLHARPH